MGILINLGAPTKVSAVKVIVSQQGASVALRAGTTDPGNTSRGRRARSPTTFTPIGHALEDHGRHRTSCSPVPQDAADRAVPAGLDHEAARPTPTASSC